MKGANASSYLDSLGTAVAAGVAGPDTTHQPSPPLLEQQEMDKTRCSYVFKRGMKINSQNNPRLNFPNLLAEVPKTRWKDHEARVIAQLLMLKIPHPGSLMKMIVSNRRKCQVNRKRKKGWNRGRALPVRARYQELILRTNCAAGLRFPECNDQKCRQTPSSPPANLNTPPPISFPPFLLTWFDLPECTISYGAARRQPSESRQRLRLVAVPTQGATPAVAELTALMSAPISLPSVPAPAKGLVGRSRKSPPTKFTNPTEAPKSGGKKLPAG